MSDVIVDQSLVRELLHYEPETGVFTWKRRDRKHFSNDQSWKTWNTRFAGTIAGADILGYREIQIFYCRARSHNLAWLYMHGRWPIEELDHINRNRSDNRICNLREASRMTNCRNMPRLRNNKSGVTGVMWLKREKKWRAYISSERNKSISLGEFSDFFEAVCRRKSAERKFGYDRNHGKTAGEIK